MDFAIIFHTESQRKSQYSNLAYGTWTHTEPTASRMLCAMPGGGEAESKPPPETSAHWPDCQERRVWFAARDSAHMWRCGQGLGAGWGYSALIGSGRLGPPVWPSVRPSVCLASVQPNAEIQEKMQTNKREIYTSNIQKSTTEAAHCIIAAQYDSSGEKQTRQATHTSVFITSWRETADKTHSDPITGHSVPEWKSTVMQWCCDRALPLQFFGHMHHLVDKTRTHPLRHTKTNYSGSAG